MKFNSRQANQQYSSFNLKDFFGMNNPKKILLPVALVVTFCALGLVFFSFVNPSYDQEAALKMKPIFFGSTRVADEPVNSITLIAPTRPLSTLISCHRRCSSSLMICFQTTILHLMLICI